MAKLHIKLARIVSRQDQLKHSFNHLRSQIKIGLLEAEDVFNSLAVPLTKLVGLKSAEMAEEGRSSTVFMNICSNSQYVCEDEIRVDLHKSMPTAKRECDLHKLEEDYTENAIMAGNELIHKQKLQLIQLVQLLKQVESCVNSSQKNMFQTIDDQKDRIHMFLRKAVTYISVIQQSSHDGHAFNITLKLLKAIYDHITEVLSSVEGGVDNLISKLTDEMCKPMIEYVKSYKAEMTAGTCPRLLVALEDMRGVARDGRVELEQARKMVRVAEERKAEALSMLRESEERLKKTRQYLDVFTNVKKEANSHYAKNKLLAPAPQEDQTKDDKLLWELLKKKQAHQQPESPFGPKELLRVGTSTKNPVPITGASHRPTTRAYMKLKTHSSGSLLPLGLSPSLTRKKSGVTYLLNCKIPLSSPSILKPSPFSISISIFNSISVTYNSPAASMGNCFSGGGHGKFAVGGTSSDPNAHRTNDAVDNFFKSRGYNSLFYQIELSLSAANLRDRDMLSKSDPLAVVYTKGKDGSLQELGRTEVVLNSLNPQWITKIKVAYCFETVQTLLFRVYDVDTQFHGPEVKTLKLDDQQYLGECTCTLSQIVTDPKRSWTTDLVSIAESTESTQPKKLGQLTVLAEVEHVSKTTAELTFRCSDLENKDFFSKSDCFLVISKYVESGATIPICRTEVLKNTLRPEWKPVFLNMSQVGSKDSPLIIECFNFNSNGKHDSLGKAQKSLAELENLSYSKQGENLFLPITIGKDHQSKVLKSQLFVEKFSESVHHTFLDYFFGGCEMNFMVAIDFTASNGNPRLPDSLHYIDYSGRLNAYQKAIQEVGDVLQFYDHDKEFPAWGFGARPIDGPISHCFNLNGSSGDNPSVAGIQGIMTAYGQALSNVSLAGPTLFGPVITSAATIASQAVVANEHKYFVLLIITDGVITDQQETIDAIVMASELPMSILIVGVGGADFKEMEILDADKGEKLHSSTGRIASRDIVQFVPFRDVQGGEMSVVQSLLAELPSQFLTYMRNNGIEPKTKLPTPY
ncbi:hypothetical protein SSX86_000343 [Deinandra increscens subsp. villosa]|uniref:C2 domain-containing protein n=1 Tax=Deinandra increscens subsp. villosa TaxID=3103831 RepID=A0AAP0DWB3_9ASTR